MTQILNVYYLSPFFIKHITIKTLLIKIKLSILKLYFFHGFVIITTFSLNLFR